MSDQTVDKGNVFLKEAILTCFGKYNQQTIGPFEPGFNILFGVNEAGKSTLSSFISQILFGWLTRKETPNPYEPFSGTLDSQGVPKRSAHRRRAGSLVMAGDVGEWELIRSSETTEQMTVITHRGVFWDEAFRDLTQSTDKITYNSIFNFDSFELSELEVKSNALSKLLSASAGNLASPVDVYETITRQVKESGSERKNVEGAVIRLKHQLEEAEAIERALQRRSGDLLEIRAQAAELSMRLTEIRTRLSYSEQRTRDLISLQESTRRTGADLLKAREKRDSLRREEAETHKRLQSDDALSPHEAYRLERQKEFPAFQEAVTIYRSAYAREEERKTEAAFAAEALAVFCGVEGETLATPSPRVIQASAMRKGRSSENHRFFLIALLLIIIGAITGVVGYATNSMVDYALAGLEGAAGIFTMLIALRKKTPLAEDALAEQQKASEMQSLMTTVARAELFLKQAEKKRHDQEQILVEHARRFDARVMDGASAVALFSELIAQLPLLNERSRSMAHLQGQWEALQDACAAAERHIASLERKQHLVMEQFDVQTVDALNEKLVLLVDQLEHEAADAKYELDDGIHRAGEYEQMLREGLDETALEEAKRMCFAVDAQLKQSMKRRAELVIAQYLLQQAIELWEKDAQPVLLRHAGELLTLITGGAWNAVRITPDQRIIISDAAHREFSPEFLSTGTLQQVYLALRIAVLIVADDVGRGLPVVADDILVHFDDNRRIGAARALIELARHRQVIMSTSHQEIVMLLRQLDPSINCIAL